MSPSRYIWQTLQISPRYLQNELAEHQQPYSVDPPQGYMLHSWNPNPFSNGTVIVCWIRIPSGGAANPLTYVPAEWIGPALEWFKRWVVKQ